MLPTFLIIGAMKAGTTSLYQYLRIHPEVSMSDRKELDFFVLEKNYYLGLDWYKRQFTENSQKWGEASPNYTKYPIFQGVVARMHAILPRVKLIYLVRDPIERIISHYIHAYNRGFEKRRFSDALSRFENNIYIVCSQYFMQLEQYLNFYSREQILVISAEGLRNDRQTTLKNVFQFLEVDSNFTHRKFDREYNLSSEMIIKNRLGKAITSLKFLKHLKSWFPPSLIELYKGYTENRIQRPVIPQDLYRGLANYLKDDIYKFKQFTEEEYNQWQCSDFMRRL